MATVKTKRLKGIQSYVFYIQTTELTVKAIFARLRKL